MKAVPLRKARLADRQPTRDGSSVAVNCGRVLLGWLLGQTASGSSGLQAARRAFGAAVAFTAVLVTAWKLASATSAACLAALWALS